MQENRSSKNGGVILASTTNQNPHPRRDRRRKQPNTAAMVLSVIGKVVGTLLLIGLITGAILVCFAAVYIRTVILPQASLDANFDMNLTSTIYYQDSNTGEYVEHLSLHGTENRELVSYSQIPEDLINATVAIEDETFWTHHGVNWKRTLKGVLLMFTGGDIQGGSTITQQLIKNFTQYDDVTVKRKILEIFRALDFDATYDKTQIMEWYLNYIYLGDNCYGVATAAQNYFGKDVSELSLAECASLISITNNPTIYGPYSNVRMTNPDTGVVTTGRERNKQRQELVLWKMKELGMISQEEYESAVAEELVFERGENEEKETTIYNWYDEQVITDVMNDLMEEYGYSEQLASDLVLSGGLKIYACADPEIQSAVEEVYSDRSNLQLTSKSGQEIQSAIVIIDQDGNVVGLAGALGEKTTNRGWNYASRSTRQPGSSIKPLSVYAPALEYGLITPATVFDDYPVQLLGSSAWPSNSYGYYKGRMNVAAALEISSNPVAVRTFQELGVEQSFQFMEEKFHINLEEGRESNGEVVSDKGAAQLALGGLTDGVRVIDMAAAYSVFPRDGVYIEPRTYTKVTREVDGQEVVLLDNTDQEEDLVLSSETTWYINDMLQNVVEGEYGGATGTGARISGMTVAGKTGSTNSNNDRWFVGYTPYYTAAVWVGYEMPERISASGNPAATLWQKVMSKVHEGLEDKDFNQPSGLKSVSICLDSGLLADDACLNDPRGSRVKNVYLFEDDIPTERCNLHTSVEVCTDDPILNGDGTAIEGLYHLAGDYCPRGDGENAGSVKTIGILNYVRESVGGVSARDSVYLYSFLEAQGSCTVHTSAPEPEPEQPTEYDPSQFRIEDPSTWPPVNDPRYEDFDPENPATYPKVETTPEETPSGGEGTATAEPTPSASAEPSSTPSEEPYVPVEGQ